MKSKVKSCQDRPPAHGNNLRCNSRTTGNTADVIGQHACNRRIVKEPKVPVQEGISTLARYHSTNDLIPPLLTSSMLPLLAIQTPQTVRVLILQSLNLPLACLLLLRLLQAPLHLITFNLYIMQLLLTTRFCAAEGLSSTFHGEVLNRGTWSPIR